MFNNTSCEKFKSDINNVINNCQLPVVVAYYILKDSLNELKDVCKEVIEYQANNPVEQEKNEQPTETKEEVEKEEGEA